jgi:hypothetical protein
MPITGGQLKLYLTGGVSNNDPDLSLGGVISTTEFQNNTLENLFSSIPPQEALVGSVKYRALDLKNTSGLTAYDGILYVHTETTSTYTSIDVGIDTGTQTIADEDTAPSSPAISFSHPLSLAAGISLGDVVAGGTKRIWFRRTVAAGATSLASDLGAILISFGTI